MWCNAAASELLNVATRHKEAPQPRKHRAAVRYSLVYGASFFRGGGGAKMPNMPKSAYDAGTIYHRIQG